MTATRIPARRALRELRLLAEALAFAAAAAGGPWWIVTHPARTWPEGGRFLAVLAYAALAACACMVAARLRSRRFRQAERQYLRRRR